MLHASTTLRCVIVFYTPLGLEWTEEGDDDDNPAHVHYRERWRGFERARLAERAQPQMRFLVLKKKVGQRSMIARSNWNGWWHRQAGIDLYSAQW